MANFGYSWNLSDPEQYQYYIYYQIFYDYLISTGKLDNNALYALTSVIDRMNLIANLQKVVYSNSFIKKTNDAIFYGDYEVIDGNTIRFGGKIHNIL
jgi:hypothetical protein